MDFRLLGPLEVAGRDGLMALGGVKQRSLLAVLLLHANEVVSTDLLIDSLWGAEPPATCGKTVQVYVSRLRKGIGDQRLATRAPGYVLHVDPSELDLARFEQLVAEAGSAPPNTAARKLRQALELWRGPALADLAYEPFAQAEIARLEELRLTALEQRIDADLELGQHAQLVGELEALVARNRLRERLRYQLMLALYRSARQAEALEAYRAARRELAEELGLEPSGALRALQQAILRQAPELDLQNDGPARAPPRPRPVPTRALLVVPQSPRALALLLSVARPLADSEPPRELIVAGVVAPEQLQAETKRLAACRDDLLAEGLAARTAAFSSPAPGDDIARLAGQEGVDLLLLDAGAAPLAGSVRPILEQAPCDVALLVEAGGALGDGPVVVPFGAGAHDWAALELGAWVARAAGAPLRLIGAADRRHDGRDASRLLADASLIVQRTAGILAEPLLPSRGKTGVAALADGAGLLVVGLSERWREEGLGHVRTQLAEAPPVPTVFVRRGARPGGLAPAESRTPFSWSLAGTAS